MTLYRSMTGRTLRSIAHKKKLNMKIIIIKLREDLGLKVGLNLKLWYLDDIIHTFAAQQGVKVWGKIFSTKKKTEMYTSLFLH